jgi:synaptic vesicle membrane protein VAT-1
MRALWLTRTGGLENLAVIESEIPTPQPGQLRVRVHAAGLNFAEILIRQGLYPAAPELPAILGFEAAGVVDAISTAVSPERLGKRVVVRASYGAHAGYVCVPDSSVYELPPSLSFEEAVCLPVSYVTAYHALFRVGQLRQGDRVLVHAAGGGVGIAAVQLAAQVEGVTVFGTSSAFKHSVLRENGCTWLIDYHSKDYESEVMRITSGVGVNVVLDSLGGSDTAKSYRLLSPEGRLVCFGFTNLVNGERRDARHVVRQAKESPAFTVKALISDNKSVAGFNLFTLAERGYQFRAEAIQILMRLYLDGKIRPQVPKRLKLEEAASGYELMQRGGSIGKIVLLL